MARLSDSSTPHVKFVLLAEFDIDKGSILKHSFPHSTGTNEHLLAEHMLPDGAHDRLDDWTVFYLNQIPELTVRDNDGDGRLLYVLSLVRTKKVATVRRGALVKALAIATYSPFIQIYKPILLLALDEYFKNPTIACLEKLYTSVNAMDTQLCPQLSLNEKLILRSTERKDMFDEKFFPSHSNTPDSLGGTGDIYKSDIYSFSSESIDSKDDSSDISSWRTRSRTGTLNSVDSSHSTHPSQSNKRSFNLKPKDTHYFETTLSYGDNDSFVSIPTRIPLSTLPGEVGDYSLINLFRLFTSPPSGPQHHHLHTNGSLTHPIILLFNALITEKRVMFLGHGRPAGEVADFVLAACALGSGCGVLKGVEARAFPYTNLSNFDGLQTVPGFIAGVCNPAFAEKTSWWDVLCNIETGKIIISKDIRPVSCTSSKSISGTISAARNVVGEGEIDEMGRMSANAISNGNMNLTKDSGAGGNLDTIFMEEITTAIQSHYGESYIRSRFTDYLNRFILVASKFEEDSFGFTKIGFPFVPFREGVLGQGSDDVGKRDNGRIEGWRTSLSYQVYKEQISKKITGEKFDLNHQLSRLRNGKKVGSAEILLIFQTLAEQIHSDEEIVAVLALLPAHFGGLLPIAFGLFHPLEQVREYTVQFFNTLNSHPTGQKFLQTLNAFHRLTYQRLRST